MVLEYVYQQNWAPFSGGFYVGYFLSMFQHVPACSSMCQHHGALEITGQSQIIVGQCKCLFTAEWWGWRTRTRVTRVILSLGVVQWRAILSGVWNGDLIGIQFDGQQMQETLAAWLSTGQVGWSQVDLKRLGVYNIPSWYNRLDIYTRIYNICIYIYYRYCNDLLLMIKFKPTCMATIHPELANGCRMLSRAQPARRHGKGCAKKSQEISQYGFHPERRKRH